VKKKLGKGKKKIGVFVATAFFWVQKKLN